LLLQNVSIGRDCRIHKAIIGEDCVIRDGAKIGIDPEHDCKRYYLGEKGVTLVTAEMLSQSQ